MHAETQQFLEKLAALRYCDRSFDFTAKKLETPRDRFEPSKLDVIPLEHRSMLAALGRMSAMILKANDESQSEALGMFLEGQSGAGKTYTIQWLVKRYPPYVENGRRILPVVHVSTPSKPDIINLAESILEALGDVNPRDGTKEEKRRRIFRLLKNLRVRLLILDEFQHFVDHGGKSMLEVTNWLKNFVSLVRIPMVVAGLPRCEELLVHNEQMARRFPQRFYLTPFHHRTDNGFHEFRSVLKELQSRLPIPCIPLHHPDIADRFLMATEGLMGHVITVLDFAVDLANDQQCEIDSSVLAGAFKEAVWKLAPHQLNPFLTTEGLRSLRQMGEPFANWDCKFGAGDIPWARLH